MAQTGASYIDAESAYVQSFGNLKAGTRYYDVTNNVDLRKADSTLGSIYAANVKAMTAVGMGAGTTDKAIIPVYCFVSLNPSTSISASITFSPYRETYSLLVLK